MDGVRTTTPEPMSLAQIKDFWVKAGDAFPTTSQVTPTSRDPYLGALERANIGGLLTKDMNVLEIGCGDGSHTLTYAKSCGTIHGVDISPGLLEVARSRAEKGGATNVSWTCGSVMELDKLLAGKTFDCLISQRCLINLPDWDHQMRALDSLAKLVKPGGMFLLTEGFTEPLDELNKVRTANGLPAIQVVPYNHNFSVPKFDAYIVKHFDIAEVRDYGFYLFMSRTLHPMAVAPDSPKHDGPINRATHALDAFIPKGAFKQFSYNLLYVLKKKG